MHDAELLRYSRHILLEDIGVEGQQRILSSHVFMVGAGGLGCAAGLYLAAAGVGTLTIADGDIVDATNLQRQIAHTEHRIGMNKAESLCQAIAAVNPRCTVHTIARRLHAQELGDYVPRVTVVLDGSDNFATRHALNAACVAHSIPLVSAAALQFSGQCAVFDMRLPTSPCYACIFPPHTEPLEAQCSTMGVFSPLVGIMGSLQAAHALKLIARIGDLHPASLILVDSLDMQWQTLHTPRNPRCPICHHRPLLEGG